MGHFFQDGKNFPRGLFNPASKDGITRKKTLRRITAQKHGTSKLNARQSLKIWQTSDNIKNKDLSA